MQESSVYQHLIETAGEERYEQGIQQGIEREARQTSIESTLLILSERFPNADVAAIKRLLESILEA